MKGEEAIRGIYAITLGDEKNPLEPTKPLIVITLVTHEGNQRVELSYDEAWKYQGQMTQLLYSIAQRNRERKRK